MDYIKISKFLTKGDKDWFHISRGDQEAYLNKLRHPKDTIDRGWLQYKCQKPFINPFKRLIMEFAAAFYFPFFIIISLCRKHDFCKKLSAIGDFNDIIEVIPNTLKEKYTINNDVWDRTGSLNLNDAYFCLKLALRYPISPIFVLKCSIYVAKFCSFYFCYNPDAIIQHNEYSFTSSVCTAYCRTKGIKHINVMHGEKLYWIRDSFFEYDECYVWAEHYKKLLINLRAEPNQFRVFTPPSLCIDIISFYDKNKYADFKYYLSYYSDTEIQKIVDSLSLIKKYGATIKFRPHPRYSDVQLLKKYVNDNDIEYPEDVSIFESIANLKWAVGSSSTALLQAYYSSREVICDDITYLSQYYQLAEHDWILSSQNVRKLSDLKDLLERNKLSFSKTVI